MKNAQFFSNWAFLGTAGLSASVWNYIYSEVFLMGEGNQERNIMILFLSNLHYRFLKNQEDKRNVLGEARDYKVYPSGTIKKCVETNEAPLLDVLAYLKDDKQVEHSYLDAVFYFVTNKVKNCDVNGTLNPPIEIYEKEEDLEAKWRPVSEEEFFWTERAEKITGLTFRKMDIKTVTTPVQTIAPDAVWRIPVDFNEDDNVPVKGVITAVTNMEKAIRAYLGTVPMERCNIYADITGGFRTASMAMSAVVQLLVYQDAKLRRAEYSDFQTRRVSDVQPINDMYRLVAGVDAFRRYGSSAELNEYFRGVEYPKLQELLTAMNAFSESVLLCQPNDIEKNIKTLMDALDAFQQKLKNDTEENRPVNEKVALFERMLDDLKVRYEPMYPEAKDIGERKTDRLAIIKWCVDNTLLQQAVTFCTEWLPEYFVNWGAIYTEDLAVIKYCSSSDFPKYRTWEKNLLMQFCTMNVLQRDKEGKGKNALDKITDKAAGLEIPVQIREIIVRAAEENNVEFHPEMKNAATGDRWKTLPTPILSPLKNFLMSLPFKLKELKQWNDGTALPYDTKPIRKLLKKTYNKPWNICVSTAEIPDLLSNILQYTKQWNLHDYETFFSITDLHYRYANNYGYNETAKLGYEAAEESLHKNMKGKVINAGSVSHAMFDCGLLKTDLSTTEEALHHIREYTYIRTELRNKMNHVSEEKENKEENGETAVEEYVPMKIEKIKTYLEKYLKEIEDLKKKLQYGKGNYSPKKEAAK